MKIWCRMRRNDGGDGIRKKNKVETQRAKIEVKKLFKNIQKKTDREID